MDIDHIRIYYLMKCKIYLFKCKHQIPCYFCKVSCELCQNYTFCNNSYKTIFENEDIKEIERIYGSYKNYPACKFCINQGNCDDYYFGDFNIKNNSN